MTLNLQMSEVSMLPEETNEEDDKEPQSRYPCCHSYTEDKEEEEEKEGMSDLHDNTLLLQSLVCGGSGVGDSSQTPFRMTHRRQQ